MKSALGEVFDRHALPHVAYDVATLAIVAVNDAAIAYYGWSRDELLRMSRADLLDQGEHEALRRFLEGLPASATTGPQRAWHERHRSGRALRSDVRGTNLHFDGRSVRVSLIQDAWPRLHALEDAERQRQLLAVAGSMGRLGGWRLNLATGFAHHSEQVREIHELGPGDGFDLAGALSFYPQPGRDALVAAVEACRTAGEPFDLELPFITARGNSRWVRARGEPVRDEDGQIVALHGALQDVTERHRAEAELAESRARLDAVVRALPDLWIVFDADNRYIDVSDPNHPALSGPWSAKVGQRLHDTIDPDLARQIRAAADEARDTGRLRSYFYDMVVRSGERRHFEGRSVPMDGGRWMNLVRDTTEIVQLEQRFRLIADALPIGVFETDAHGACRYVNPAWQTLHGLSQADAAGDGWIQALHPDDRAEALRSWTEAAKLGGRYKYTNRLRRRDGTERLALIHSTPVRRADGTLIAHVGTSLDTTEAAELEQARRAREVAEEVARRQASFLSRLSHELRTPLNAIVGFTDLMLLQQPAGAPAGALNHVRDAGAHMLALVNDLLDLQQLQQGQAPMKPETVALRGLVQSCIALLDPLVRQRQVRVSVEVDTALELATDRRGLQQVLLNLASNAVKYGQRTGGHLAIRATADDHGSVQVAVSDDGPGMTADQLQRLFQPFERLGQERSGQPGTGLGLVITRQLVQWLGGELSLASQPGVGTIATVSLPGVVKADPARQIAGIAAS
jgi:PAS domain S-box-containing protein